MLPCFERIVFFTRCTVLTAIILVPINDLRAQTDDSSVVATQTNLSSALPASQWARVETSVDRGLSWLASQQAEDGRFPSDDIGQPAVTSLAMAL